MRPRAGCGCGSSRLGGDDRRRARARARLRGRGREAVPHPVLVDGADAPLREAGRLVRGPLQRPRDREPARLSLREPEARADRRLPRAEGRVRDRRHVRQAADRPARRHSVRAERLRLDQRQAARTSRTSTRSCATRSADTWHVPEGPLLLHGRRPGALVRLAHVGIRAALEPRRARAFTYWPPTSWF